MADISIIIPTRNEVARIGALVRTLRGAEVIVADGWSTDATARAAREAGAVVVSSPPGRGGQMNAGAAVASGGVLLFLHADTALPEGWAGEVRRILDGPGMNAGAFRLGIEGKGIGLRLVEKGVDLRSRWLGMPYGDQAIFLRREAFEQLGGYRPIPAMEDFDLVRRLRRLGRIGMSPLAVRTGGRMWARRGVVQTTLLNAACVAGYHVGVPPGAIARWRGVDLPAMPQTEPTPACPPPTTLPPRPSA